MTLPAVTPFYAPGVTKVRWAQTLANKASPTRAEITSSTLLTRIKAFNGWMLGKSTIEAPDMDSDFVSKVGGRYQADDSDLDFYAAKTGADIRALLQVDNQGFLLFMDGGDVAASLMDVYPVLVIGMPYQRGDSEPASIKVQFAITSKPALNVAIPALT